MLMMDVHLLSQCTCHLVEALDRIFDTICGIQGFTQRLSNSGSGIIKFPSGYLSRTVSDIPWNYSHREVYQWDYKEGSTPIVFQLGPCMLKRPYRTIMVTAFHVRLSNENIHICLGKMPMRCLPRASAL